MLEGDIKVGVATLGAVDVEQGLPVDVAAGDGSDALKFLTVYLEGACKLLLKVGNGKLIESIAVDIGENIPVGVIEKWFLVVELLNHGGQLTLHGSRHLSLSYDSEGHSHDDN